MTHFFRRYGLWGKPKKQNVTWLMWYDDVTHFICVTWWVQLVKVWGGQNTTWAPVTRLIHELSMKKQTERELLGHDSSIFFPKKMSWLIQCFFYINKKTQRELLWRDPFIWVNWLNSNTWDDFERNVQIMWIDSVHSYEWVNWLNRMNELSQFTHS